MGRAHPRLPDLAARLVRALRGRIRVAHRDAVARRRDAGAESGGTAPVSSIQSALAPASPQAARLAHLWWIFFWVCLAVYVLTIAFFAWAIASRISGGSFSGSVSRSTC